MLHMAGVGASAPASAAQASLSAARAAHAALSAAPTTAASLPLLGSAASDLPLARVAAAHSKLQLLHTRILSHAADLDFDQARLPD